MTEITYWELLAAITLVWVILRLIIGFKNKGASFKREAQMLLVYICIIVIARIVYFPMRHVDGHIGTLKFDPERIWPLRFNLVPIVHMFDIYDGWLINIIGNITMFIPVGIIWPICFRRLDTILKTILAGFGYTLLIELSQLLLYERSSDIDDIILNTAGFTIGAVITYAVRRMRHRG